MAYRPRFRGIVNSPTTDVDRVTILKFDDQIIRLDGKVAMTTVNHVRPFHKRVCLQDPISTSSDQRDFRPIVMDRWEQGFYGRLSSPLFPCGYGPADLLLSSNSFLS